MHGASLAFVVSASQVRRLSRWQLPTCLLVGPIYRGGFVAKNYKLPSIIFPNIVERPGKVRRKRSKVLPNQFRINC